MWLLFVVASLVTGALGAVNLVRSGFFKEVQARDERPKLAQLQWNRRGLEAESATFKTKALPREAELLTVTESTTRELVNTAKKKSDDNDNGGTEMDAA